MSLYAWKMFVPFLFSSSQQVIHTQLFKKHHCEFLCARARGRGSESPIHIFWVVTTHQTMYNMIFRAHLNQTLKAFVSCRALHCVCAYVCVYVALRQCQPIHIYCELIQQKHKIKKKYVCAWFRSLNFMLYWLAGMHRVSCSHTRPRTAVSCASAIVRAHSSRDKYRANERQRKCECREKT